MQGISAHHDLRGAARAKAVLLYADKAVPRPAGMDAFEIECEVYRAEEGGPWMVHSVCPRCRHSIIIDGRKKRVDFDPQRGLFTEPFGCPWELSDDRKEFGLSLCRLRVVYDGHVVRDA